MLNFILGLLFAYLILPLIQCITSAANIKTQEYSYIVSERVANIQKKIQETVQQQGEEQETKYPMGFQSTSAVGFEVNDEEQDQEGEYE